MSHQGEILTVREVVKEFAHSKLSKNILLRFALQNAS